MTVIAATLLTDRKPAFPVSLEYLVNEPLIDRVYINIQTGFDASRYQPVLDFMDASKKPYDVDLWRVESTWSSQPQFDQDNARFMPIATGRNMALDWAIVQCMMNQSTSHLLFVDSDVRPHQGGLQYLLDLEKPLTGGLVPGRGDHSHVKYVFPDNQPQGTVIKCEHGTSGYLLIARSIFEVQRFRVGPCRYKREVTLCDDPAYSTDAFDTGLADGWYIDVRATADHVDDPNHPLKLEEAINNYQVGGSSS